MDILAIETSCDETSAAIIRNGTEILSNIVSSSKDFHEKYGGIFPELAARKQLEFILPVVQAALNQANINYQDTDAIAVTVGPGLIGSLLIGVEAARTIAYVTGKPIIPVNHVLAHMYANFINNENNHFSSDPDLIGRFEKPDQESSRLRSNNIVFPAISLVVSGGHTELYLMESSKKIKWLGGTVDDAAGECFDKTARLIGFGNRGGLAIQEAADKINSSSLTVGNKLPRPMIYDKSLNFSFSGLKTAVVREVNKLKENQRLDDTTIAQLSHEVQEAITDVLVTKTINAAKTYNAKSILISGGVAANLRLRKKLNHHLITNHLQLALAIPQVNLCTDNAASIASYAYFRGQPVNWREIIAAPDLSVEV